MSKLQFYTDFYHDGTDTLHVKGYDVTGAQVVETFDCPVEVYSTEDVNKGAKKSPYKTLKGEPLYLTKFGCIYDTRRQAKNQELYGNLMFEYTAIDAVLPGGIKADPEKIRTVIIDIETEVPDVGFPSPHEALSAVNCVTIVDLRCGVCHVVTTLEAESFNLLDVKGSEDYTVDLVKTPDEVSLLNQVRSIIINISPDVLTGWNVENFDVPYLVNRTNRLFGDNRWAKSLSPWNKLSERKQAFRGEQVTTYEIPGLVVLDYLDLYKSFAKPSEFYRLDYVAEKELGQNKLKYEGKFRDFYTKEPQRFVKYNVIDCTLVANLDKKLNYLGLVYMMAYKSKVKYKDTFMQVRMWEVMIYNWLKANRGVIAPCKKVGGFSDMAGAFVTDPIPGLYEWCVTFDVTSLYPSLMMMLNISPDTLVGKLDITPKQFDSDEFDKASVENNNACIAANGALFTKTFRGFIPSMVEGLFNERKVVKAEMLDVERQIKKLEDAGASPDAVRSLRIKHINLNNTQTALKLNANSCFGALGSPMCMWGDKVLGEAITLSGQYTVMNAGKELDKFLSKVVGYTESFAKYSDTDSIILCLGPIVKKVLGDTPSREVAEKFIDDAAKKSIAPRLEKIFQAQATKMMVVSNKIVMKREYIADKSILIKSKNYVLNVINKEGGISLTQPKLVVKGLELVRSSTPVGCRQAIAECLRLVFTSTEAGVLAHIEEFKKLFTSLPPSQIGKPTGINNIKEYYNEKTDTFKKKSTPIQLTSAIAYNRLIDKNELGGKYPKIYEGDKVSYVYLRKPNPSGLHVIAFIDTLPSELQIAQYIDRDVQFEKTFIKPCKRFLDVIGWRTEAVEELDLF